MNIQMIMKKILSELQKENVFNSPKRKGNIVKERKFLLEHG